MFRQSKGIKSTQKGTTTISATTGTTTITAVDMNKAMLIFNHYGTTADYPVNGRLTAANTISWAQRSSATAAIYWQVIEYY